MSPCCDCRVMSCFQTLSTALALLLVMLLPAPGHTASAFLDEAAIPWKVNAFEIARWKTLIGGNEGGQLDEADVRFGLWELAPNATYHGHRHDAPEIYFLTAGAAEWTVGAETRRVGPGSVVLTPPGAVHRMVNVSDTPVSAIWFWWAPDGRRAVFEGTYEFTEPAPEQPEGAGFDDGAGEQLHAP